MKKFVFAFGMLTALSLVAFAGNTLFDPAGLTPEQYAIDKAAMNGERVVVTSLCNAAVCVQIDEDGDFNIGTAAGICLLYAYPSEPWSSDIRVRVDGLVYNLEDEYGNACNGQATFVSWSNDGTSIFVNYTLLGYLTVQVIHTPVMFNATAGAILTQTKVTNNHNTTHQIGVLYEYDTMINQDDAARLYLGPNLINVETCYNAPFPYPYWDAIDAAATATGRGTFTGLNAVTPDHLAFGKWPDFYGTCWDRVCDGQVYYDSAVLYQWNEDPVAPGASRTVGTYYGVGEMQVTPGDLQISVTLPQLECVIPPAAVQPNPFQILVTVTNTGGSTCNGVSVLMSDGAGPGGTATITSTNPVVIGSLNPNQSAQATFTAQLTANPDGGCVNFTVNVTSSDCDPNQANFCVVVPPCRWEADHGDLDSCNYPTYPCNPSHWVTGIAWLGEWIDAETAPNSLDLDLFDDGVVFHNLPWMPCTWQCVTVMVTAGPNYYGQDMWLNAWKDGNLDYDFCDTLCDGLADEWIIQDVQVTPGVYTFYFLDPGVLDLGIYEGRFRFRLTEKLAGRGGMGNMTNNVTNCLFTPCGNYVPNDGISDALGETEDYIIPEMQLPVELTTFEAIPGDGEVTLHWSTASEDNNEKFEIARRAMENGDFSTIAAVPGAGSSTTEHHYSFVDGNVSNGVTYYYQLTAVDFNGVREVQDLIVSAKPTPTAGMASDYVLHQCYPNPFNAITEIRYDIYEVGHVRLEVFDLMGRRVASLVDAEQPGGHYALRFDASHLPTGVYLYRLEVNDFTQTQKMMLLK